VGAGAVSWPWLAMSHDRDRDRDFLSFNESQVGKLVVPGFPLQESDDIIAALQEPMPLKTPWTLWEQVASGAYSTRKVVSFSTVQDFWRVWNGVPQPSELLDNRRMVREDARGSAAPIDAIMVFREGITPEWEDPMNEKGGHFQIVVKPATGHGQIDEYWNNLVISMVGETMEAGRHITGVRLVDKLNNKGGKVLDSLRLELWYDGKTSESEKLQIKRSMERMLITRLDGSPGSQLKGDAIQDKKHGVGK